MIFAEIQGKLGKRGSQAHERAEDLFTSTVFGLLRYLPYHQGIGAVIRAARPVFLSDGDVVVRSDAAWLNQMGVDRVELAFWPQWGAYGEPDLLLDLLAADGTLVHRVLVEAKLHSPKSSRESRHRDGAERPSGNEWQPADIPDDQLAKYWEGLAALPSRISAPTTLIYLTTHSVPPRRDLKESLQRAPSMRLAWMSWTDVWQTMRDADIAGMGALVAADLCRLLRHKNLGGFEGFRQTTIAIPSQSFWRAGK